MKARIKTFQSGCGDCIFFIIEGEDGRYSVMVDCGFFSPEIKCFVTETLELHIDLLIVTHIDEDHILGIRDMLEALPKLEIKNIWFNSYRRPAGEEVPLSESQKIILERLYSTRPSVIDMISGKVSASQAVTLSEAILNHPHAKNIWSREQIDSDREEFTINGNRYGKIIMLTPRKKELDAIEEKFKSLFFELFHEEHPDVPLKKGDSIFEMLQLIANHKDCEDNYMDEKVSYEGIDDVFLINAAGNKVLKSSAANEASMAFVWEMGDSKILFAGDSSPKLLAEAVKAHYGEKLTKFIAVKVSHHGSAHGTSKTLMSLVDTPHFFFTGGEEDKRPHIDAIARIITRPLTEGIERRTLHFNYQNNWTDALKNDTELQEKYHFEVDTDTNDLCYDI